MKLMFILIALSVVLGITSYVFVRGWQALPPNVWLRILYSLTHIVTFGCFFFKMYYGDNLPAGISVVLSSIGFTWLVAVIYFAIYALSIDIVRIANHFLHFLPDYVRVNYQTVKLVLALSGVAALSLVLAVGYYKFNNPKVSTVKVSIDGSDRNRELRLVMASDIHLSSYINRGDLEKYVSLINGQNPDIVLLVGDIADRDLSPLEDERMVEVLSTIRSRYGVFAVSGNHEFYGGERDQIYDYIKSSGIIFLKDSAILTADSSLYIIGRDDHTNRDRAPLSELVKGLDVNIPKILLDHQPYNLGDAQKNGIDLQLSGHTHNGQFWPGNLIVRMIFELPYGYMKRGTTHYYVSSGLGLWGPKYRIGTESEIVLLNFRY